MGVTIDLSDANAEGVLELDMDAGGHAAGDTLYGIENLTGSKMGDDMLTGGTGANVLMGLGGNDTLTGGTGDTVNGGDGDDMLMSDVGTITAMGGDGMDTLKFAGSPAGTAITAAFLGDADSTVAAENIRGVETVIGQMNVANTVDASAVMDFAVTLTGGDMVDTFTGGGMGDMISGGEGADVLNGGAGDDEIMGGDDADSIGGGAGADMIMTGDGGGTAHGDAAADGTAVDATLHGADMITGGKDVDTLNGNGGDDTIKGMAGDDVIDGGAGNDMITGGTGNDALTGGDGADTFVYMMGDGDDTITGLQKDNFLDIIDSIDVSSLGLSAAEVRAMINASTTWPTPGARAPCSASTTPGTAWKGRSPSSRTV